MGVRPPDLTPSGADPTTGIRAARPRPSFAAPDLRVRRALVPVLWGIVFLVGGVAVWMAVPARREALPAPWRATADPAASAGGLSAEIRASAGDPGLLKLQWPTYPDARGYRIRFRDEDGRALAPVTVRSNVFLYDLGSDVLHLPPRFEWEVSAVLRDGSEVVAPPRSEPER